MKNKKVFGWSLAILGLVGVTSGVVAGIVISNKTIEIPWTGLLPAKPSEYTEENTELRLSEEFKNELIANNNINNNEIKIINISSETEKYKKDYNELWEYPFDLYSVQEKKNLEKKEAFEEIQKIFGNELNNSDAKFAIFVNGKLSELVFDNFKSKQIVVSGMESSNVINNYEMVNYIPLIISFEKTANTFLKEIFKPIIKKEFENGIYSLSYKNWNLREVLSELDYNELIDKLIVDLQIRESGHYFDEWMKDEKGEWLVGKDLKYEEFVVHHRNETNENELFIEYEVYHEGNWKFDGLENNKMIWRLENLKWPREWDNPNKIDYVSIDTKIGYNITEGVNMDEVREKVLNELIKARIVEDKDEFKEMENWHGIVEHANFDEVIIEDAITSSKNNYLNFSWKLDMNENYREEFYQKAFEWNEAKYSWDFNYDFRNLIDIEVNNRHLWIIYDKINLKNYDLLGNAIKNELNLGKERGHIIILERNEF